LNYLEEYFLNKPDGTSDREELEKESADLFLSSIKRKVFWREWQIYWRTICRKSLFFLPYKYFERFVTFIETGVDDNFQLRDDLVLAISKSEKIYNDEVGRENVCISSNSLKNLQQKRFMALKLPILKLHYPILVPKPIILNISQTILFFDHSDKTLHWRLI